MMRKVLEYTKKMALVRKLFRQGLISDQEYNKITRKMEDAYMIIGDSSFFGKTGVRYRKCHTHCICWLPDLCTEQWCPDQFRADLFGN